jgi:hypothetical protein
VRSKLQAVFKQVRSQASWRKAAAFALREPKKAWTYFRRSGSEAWKDALFEKREDYERFVAELDGSELLPNLQRELASKFEDVWGTTVRGNAYVPGAMLIRHAGILYALIRARRPGVVIETGVCNGLSSAVILQALEGNGHGHLYSIDLPEFTDAPETAQDFWQGKGGAVVPADKQSGWLVPELLRSRWTLQLGRASEILPQLLDNLGSIDLFVHDSEHSYANQLFEFRTAFARLSSGGILFASDISWSDAFDDFVKEIRGSGRHHYVDYSLAIAVHT